MILAPTFKNGIILSGQNLPILGKLLKVSTALETWSTGTLLTWIWVVLFAGDKRVHRACSPIRRSRGLDLDYWILETQGSLHLGYHPRHVPRRRCQEGQPQG
jgi:hypothetical protein